MGIQVEFNPDLALRSMEHHRRGNRLHDECIPDKLEVRKIYPFLKKGQRNYYFLEPVPLLITEGEGKLSRPIASIKILEATHHLSNGELWTKGFYQVVKVFDPQDPAIHFEGFQPR